MKASRAIAAMAATIVASTITAHADRKGAAEAARVSFEPKIAVMPPSISIQRYTTIGPEIVDMIVTAMLDAGFRLVERSQLDLVIEELGLKGQSSFDAATFPKIGKLCGAQVLLMGAVTEFSSNRRQIRIGPLTLTEEECRATLDFRAVDVRSGEILAAAKGAGRETARGGSLNGNSIEDTQNGRAATWARRRARLWRIW